MRWPAATLAIVALAYGGAPGKQDREIEAYLEGMQAPEKRYNNIEAPEGAFLRDLVRKLKAKRVLEIGTSTGYSGIWMAMGLRATGGRLITVEYDAGRHASAVANFAAVGLSEFIDARKADALEEVPAIEGPFDIVFLDAVPQQNLRYYRMVLPKVRRGGVIVCHNVKSHPWLMTDFLGQIQSDAAVRTEFVAPGWQGFSLSWLK